MHLPNDGVEPEPTSCSSSN